MRAFTRRLIPLRELDREDALAWLRDEVPDYLTVLSLAFGQVDPAARQAYTMLAQDVGDAGSLSVGARG